MAVEQLLILTSFAIKDKAGKTFRAAAVALLHHRSVAPGFLWSDIAVGWTDHAEMWIAEAWSSLSLRRHALLDPTDHELEQVLLSKVQTRHVEPLEVVLREPVHRPSVPADADPAQQIWADRSQAHELADLDKNGPFAVIARRRALPGRSNDFIAAERERQDFMQRTSGAIDLQFARGMLDPDRIWHYEVWSSKDLHDVFFDSAEHLRFQSAIIPFSLDQQDPVPLRVVARFVGPTNRRLDVPGPALAQVDRSTLPAAATEILQRVPPIAIFGMLAYAGKAFVPVVNLTLALLSDHNKLVPKLRQIAILATAVTCEVRYEWVQHLTIARRAGVTEGQIEAIPNRWHSSPVFDGTERLVLSATTEALALAEVHRPTFDNLIDRLGPEATLELLLTIGHYRSMSTVMLATALPSEPAKNAP